MSVRAAVSLFPTRAPPPPARAPHGGAGLFTASASRRSDVTDARLIGGDTDDNGGGCYVSAGYSYCSSLGKCVRSWEESCPDR